jgi:putative nucleotidyltransferase with HDIG domain
MSEERDPYTSGHQERVSLLSCAIAREMGESATLGQPVRVAGLLHDIGKIAVPSEILSKPSRLTEPEMRLVQLHPEASYRILEGIEFPWPIADMVRQHHERLDGSGYARGLKGDEICLGARILATADVVEAMVSHRPYRASLGIDAALAEIERGRGTTYDADVVDACVRLFREKGLTMETLSEEDCAPND